MKKNLKYAIIQATYSMGKLNKKLGVIYKSYQEVKKTLNKNE